MGKEKDYGCIPDIAVLLVNLVALTVAIISVIAVGVFSTDYLQDSIDTNLSIQLYSSAQTVPPSHFAIPHTSVTPVKNQQQRGTCWCFSTIGLVEGSYRAYGYKQGFLEEDEYVVFSEQAYGLGVCDYCSGNAADPFCFGGPLENSTEDGRGEWLYYFRDKPSCQVLPDSFCAYQPTKDLQYLCDNRIEGLEKNPIDFKVTQIESVYAIDSIRNALFQHQVPLLWSHGVFEATFTVPCESDSQLSTTRMCVECMFPCRVGNNNNSCCAKYISSGYGNNGIFGLHGEPYPGGGHAMLIVGYNDNFRIDTGVFGDLKAKTVGGFIIKNSWGPNMGHSMKYWAQEISTIEELGLCPNELASSTWLPVDSSCMKTQVDPDGCAGPNAYKYSRGVWKEGATVLECNTGYKSSWAFFGFAECDTTRYYAFAASPREGTTTAVWTIAPLFSDGFVRFTVVSWPKVDPTPADVRIETTKDSTWNGIEKVFKPVSFTDNDPDMCGFWFIPYQYFQEGNLRYKTSGHDTPEVSFMNIEWERTSYLKNKAEGKADDDYSFLEKSTRKQKVYNFEGPLDFDEFKTQSKRVYTKRLHAIQQKKRKNVVA